MLKVGDLIKIVDGMNIPADGICIEASDVKVDESKMSGEFELMKKDSFENCLDKKMEF